MVFQILLYLVDKENHEENGYGKSQPHPLQMQGHVILHEVAIWLADRYGLVFRGQMAQGRAWRGEVKERRIAERSENGQSPGPSWTHQDCAK